MFKILRIFRCTCLLLCYLVGGEYSQNTNLSLMQIISNIYFDVDTAMRIPAYCRKKCKLFRIIIRHAAYIVILDGSFGFTPPATSSSFPFQPVQALLQSTLEGTFGVLNPPRAPKPQLACTIVHPWNAEFAHYFVICIRCLPQKYCTWWLKEMNCFNFKLWFKNGHVFRGKLARFEGCNRMTFLSRVSVTCLPFAASLLRNWSTHAVWFALTWLSEWFQDGFTVFLRGFGCSVIVLGSVNIRKFVFVTDSILKTPTLVHVDKLWAITLSQSV